MPFWVLDYKLGTKGDLVPKAILCSSKLEADRYKEEEAHPQASIHELPTTDLSKATQMLKARRIDALSDIKGGMQRFRRK
jgi:hypothetical protein